MSLLEKALAHRPPIRRPRQERLTAEEIELLLAWVNGRLTAEQLDVALDAGRTAGRFRAFTMLLRGVRLGQLQVTETAVTP